MIRQIMEQKGTWERDGRMNGERNEEKTNG